MDHPTDEGMRIEQCEQSEVLLGIAQMEHEKGEDHLPNRNL